MVDATKQTWGGKTLIYAGMVSLTSQDPYIDNHKLLCATIIDCLPLRYDAPEHACRHLIDNVCFKMLV